MRKPKCPKCGREMNLNQIRSHYYWLCCDLSHYPVSLGIKGQDGYFQFRKLVDPITLEIVDNPYFQSSALK